MIHFTPKFYLIGRVTHTGTQRDGTPFSQVWKTIDSLGSGTYGDVVLQELQGSPGGGCLHAVKSITKKAHKNNKKILTNELKALIAVKKHPTKVVTFHGWYQDSQQTMFIAMEYVSGGSLERYMRKLKRVENILISSTSPLLVKICDFGIAKSADIDASGLKT
ncbi:uncharacterized protein H6S33_007244 [Morchella sextelata]|uniref:uncharacterized protein n=1 Tax=Morchella sextelata TaxID=1174677 RepID=UPI001D039789|nr:uncharacterized protein H6S33_007244 [Morchella sextelata]KAH0604213.1 hypothetical protein H6S33_007244 [Morchella sextelata]